MVYKEAIQKMLTFVSLTSFDKYITKKVKVISASCGKCVMQMKVEDEHADSRNCLHSGLSCALIDIAAYYAFITHPRWVSDSQKTPEMIPMSTITSSVSHQGAVKVGKEILIAADTLNIHGKIGFIEVTIRNKATLDLLVRGQQQYMATLLKPVQDWKMY